MIYDPKYVTGDIIASINGSCCTADELITRFDNHDNGILQSVILETVNRNVKRGLLSESKKGVLRCTAAGRKYIKEHGYFD